MQLTEIKLSSYQGLRNQPTGSLTVSKRYDCSEADLRLLRKIANEHDEGLLASTLSPEEQETALEILKLDANVLIVGPSDELAGRRFFVNPEVSVLLGRFTIGSLQIRESVARPGEPECFVRVYDQLHGGYLDLTLTAIDLKGLPEVTTITVTRFVNRNVIPLLEKWVPDRSCFRY